jgi:hypothetical protein
MKAPATRLLLATCALCAAFGVARAQTSMLPPQCAGMKGDALDQCVRNATPPVITPRVEPVEQKPDPRQPVNCTLVLRPDQDFCIARNDALLECRDPRKYPDPNACLNAAMKRLLPPKAADCSRIDKTQRNACAQRNKHYQECLADPLRYFICLGEKTARK